MTDALEGVFSEVRVDGVLRSSQKEASLQTQEIRHLYLVNAHKGP
jgi:hypothetical protein